MEAISEFCRVFTHFLRTQLPCCHTLLLFGFPLFAWYCVFFSVAAAAQHYLGSCAVWVAPVAGQPRESPIAALPREAGQSHCATAVGCSIPTRAEHRSRAGAACCLTSSPPLATTFPQCSCPATVLHAPTRPCKATGSGLLHWCLFIKCKGTGLSASLPRITYSACLPRLYSYKHTHAQL